MTLGVDYIGKYTVFESKVLRSGKETQVPLLYTDNCREAVWYANKAPDRNTPVNVCGERDFYKFEDKWHSFEL